jgi:hypothetical protein
MIYNGKHPFLLIFLLQLNIFVQQGSKLAFLLEEVGVACG